MLMKKHYFLSMLALLFLSAGALRAQENHVNNVYKLPDSQENLTFVFGKTTRDTAVVKVLLENAPKTFSAPGLPRFAIIGNQRKFYLGIGGFLKGTVSYDFKNPISNPNDFITSDIPMDLAKGNSGLVQMSAQVSNIAVNFVGMPGTKHQIGAYVAINFTNDNYTPDLWHGYLTYAGFTVGYTTSLFTDAAAGPPTIDFQGPNSWTLVNNAVVDYTHAFNSKWSVGIGVEMPVASATTNPEWNYMVNQRVPDIPAYVQYSWDKGSSWVRVSGLLRNMLYRDVVADRNRYSTGWGVKLSGSAKIVPKLTAYYQGLYGRGISSYYQDLTGEGMDMLPKRSSNGKMGNVESWGAYAGLQYNFTKNVFISATYSLVRLYPHGTYYRPDLYQNGQYAVGNLFWNVASNVQMGVEYIWGQRENMDGLKKNDNRIQTMIQVNF